jgi:hypothetical protein
MNAQELAQKFIAKVAAAASERDYQVTVAADNRRKRSDDVEHCKRAMEEHVIPFLTELKHHLPEDRLSFAPQIDLDHKPVGVSFKIGDGMPHNYRDCVQQYCGDARRGERLFQRRRLCVPAGR